MRKMGLLGAIVLAGAVFAQPVAAANGFFPKTSSPVGATPYRVVLADFNRDTKLDVAVSSFGGNTVHVFLGNGAGDLAAAPGSPIAAPQALGLVTSDLNKDGITDLVICGYAVAAPVLLGSGTGAFAAAPGSPVQWGPDGGSNNCYGGLSADVTSDGNPDVLLAGGPNNSITVLQGNGTGLLTFARNIVVPDANPTTMVGGDFNGDTKLDFAVTTVNSGRVYVYTGDGAGSFTAAGNYAVGGRAWGLAGGDFNGDLRLDLAAPAQSGDGGVTVFLGQGDAGFAVAPGSPFPSAPTPNGAAVADFDGDGKLDIATANDGANVVSVLLGSGAGSFTTAVGSPYLDGGTLDTAIHLAAGDMNGDGAPDLVVVNWSGARVSVLLNERGTRTSLFSSAPLVLAGTPVTFTATVAPSVGDAGTPTGAVTIRAADGGTTLAAGPLDGGTATLTATLPPGAHDLVAAFGGNTEFSPSVSPSIPQFVEAGAPDATADASPDGGSASDGGGKLDSGTASDSGGAKDAAPSPAKPDSGAVTGTPESSSGCSCDVAGGGAASQLFAAVGASLAIAALRRRRNRRQS